MSYDLVVENVPTFTRRVGDRVIEGSNNSMVILGTDRVDTLDSGLGHPNSPGGGKLAGSIHIVVGREAENPNFNTDKAFMYLSMKTNADENMNTGNIPSKHGVTSNGTSAAMIKADVTRIVSRQNIKLVVGRSSILITDGEIVLDSPSIRFGKNSNLNEMDRSELTKSTILDHQHTTPAGPTASIIPDPNIIKLTQGFLNVKS